MWFYTRFNICLKVYGINIVIFICLAFYIPKKMYLIFASTNNSQIVFSTIYAIAKSKSSYSKTLFSFYDHVYKIWLWQLFILLLSLGLAVYIPAINFFNIILAFNINYIFGYIQYYLYFYMILSSMRYYKYDILFSLSCIFFIDFFIILVQLWIYTIVNFFITI